MMKIGRWEGNEIIYTIDVVGDSVNLIEDFDFAFDIIGATAIMSGMVVTEAAIPDMTILISAGIAKDFTVGSFLIGEALVDTVTDSDPINDRRDIIEVRRLINNISPATRQFKDPITENITDQTINTETEYKTEIKVLAGTPGTGLSLPVETGWIKIAEIFIPAASLTVIDANIFNVDAEKAGVNNTSWTATMASIYRNGTISEMKTKIIDNKAATALNTTHKGSDGKNHSDVVTNTTHRGSVGSDHGFIDQDVKSSAGPTFNGGIRTNGTFLKTKVIEIGAWNMDSDGTINVAHGLSLSDVINIVDISVILIPDSQAAVSDLFMAGSDGLTEGWVTQIDDTYVYANRRFEGFFDTGAWASISNNRGHIKLVYKI